MNENIAAETMDMTETAEVTTEAGLEAFDEGWDSDGYSEPAEEAAETMEEAGSETGEADQQTEETAVEKTADEAAAADKTAGETKEAEEKADQLFTLKHLDETREVSRDEVISLAQKGMDYDRKVTKLNNELAEYKGFFEELAGNSGLSREQFIDSVKAKMLIANEKKAGRVLTERDAIFRVQKARADKAKAAQEEAAQAEAKAKAEAESKRRDDILAFTKAYPGVKVTDVPKSVWDEVNKGSDLMGAYTRYASAQTAKENAELKKRIEALEQNAKNAARSTGSRKTAGTAKAKDDFDIGWDSI